MSDKPKEASAPASGDVPRQVLDLFEALKDALSKPKRKRAKSKKKP